MSTPAPAPAPAAPAPTSDAGKTLGIVGLILAFVFSLAGLIVSAIARSQSKKAGVKNTPATVGLVLSIIFLVLGVIIAAVTFASGAVLFSGITQVCADYGTGEWVVDGITYTCG